LQAIVNLALLDGNRSKMIASGVVKPLVDLCSRSLDNTVLGNAAWALGLFARKPENRKQVVLDGIVHRASAFDS
jgi:hypothetical protein